MVSREEEAGDAYSEPRAIDEDAACEAGEVGESGRLLMAAEHGTSEVEQQQPELVFCRLQEADGVGMLNSSSDDHRRCDIGCSCIDAHCACGHSELGCPEVDSSSSGAVDLGKGFGDRTYARYDRRAEARSRSRSRSRSFPRQDSGVGQSLFSVPEGDSDAYWEDKDEDIQSSAEGEEEKRPPATPTLESRWQDQMGCRGSFSMPRPRTFSFDEGDDLLISTYIKMARIDEQSQGSAESVDEAPPELMI